MDVVNRDFERTTKKARTAFQSVNERVDNTILVIEQARDALKDPSANKVEVLMQLHTELKKAEHAPARIADRKEFYKQLNHFGKTVDKHLKPLHGNLYECKPSFDPELLNEVIARHLFRSGDFEVAELFVRESQCSLTDEDKQPFIKMFRILEAMSNNDLSCAIEWCQENREELIARGSNLEFCIHRIEFIKLLRKGERGNALQHIRKHIAPFAEWNMHSIQRLMGCFLYADDLENSPYKDLLGDAGLEEIRQQFTADCCALLGMSSESALFFVLRLMFDDNVGPSSTCAGVQALPTLLKYASLSKDGNWTKSKELPVEVELGAEYKFHSIFTCPVSREQATPSNPPMLPFCGHVLCKATMEKLAKGSSSRFKCPYCPTEQSASNAKQLYFN